MEGFKIPLKSSELELVLHEYDNFYDFVGEQLPDDPTTNSNSSTNDSTIFQLVDVCPDTNGAPVEEFLTNLPNLIEITEGYLKVCPNWSKNSCRNLLFSPFSQETIFPLNKSLKAWISDDSRMELIWIFNIFFVISFSINEVSVVKGTKFPSFLCT